MSNFKIGQKVCVNTTPKRVHKNLRGKSIDIIHWPQKGEVVTIRHKHTCLVTHKVIYFFCEYTIAFCSGIEMGISGHYLSPLTYTSNTNLEIISLFAPTEERADLTPEPKKETA